MPELEMKREVLSHRVRYHLQGVFTHHAARELATALAVESAPIELDFSRTRQCFDLGLAALATELREGCARHLEVELHGLGMHHRRLLRYLGVEVGGERSEPSRDDPLDDPAPDRALARA